MRFKLQLQLLFRLIAVQLVALALAVPVAVQADSFWDRFRDSEDGQFDLSNNILNKAGFLPLPIIITEPAVGLGGGVALVYFHARPEQHGGRAAGDGEQDVLPPSISGAAGLVTTNDSWAAGGAHFGSWREDRYRYLGALARPSFNLTYHGGGQSADSEAGFSYNLEGWYVLQELRVRVAASDFFIGGGLRYSKMTSRFELQDPVAGLPPLELVVDALGFDLLASFDSRDNIMTPNHGIDAEISAGYVLSTNNDDNSYQIYRAAGKSYWELGSSDFLGPRGVIGWRLDGRFSGGDVPFYALPFIQLRGIPALRYQGEMALMTELELRWRVYRRWSLVGFTGVGSALDSIKDLGVAPARVTAGVGFRYYIARLLRMHAGVDVARGREDWAVYLTTGHAWSQ